MTDATTIAGCSRQTILRAIHAGRVRAERTGAYRGRPTWRFKAEDLEEDLAQLRCRHPSRVTATGTQATYEHETTDVVGITWLTMKEATAIARCTRPTMHAAIQAGRVRAEPTVRGRHATWRFNAEHFEEDLEGLRALRRGAHSGRCPVCRQAAIIAPLKEAPAIVHLLEPGEVIPRGPCVRCAGSGRDHQGDCARCRGAGVDGVEISADETLFALSTTGRTRAMHLRDRRFGEALHRSHECPGRP